MLQLRSVGEIDQIMCLNSWPTLGLLRPMVFSCPQYKHKALWRFDLTWSSTGFPSCPKRRICNFLRAHHLAFLKDREQTVAVENDQECFHIPFAMGLWFPMETCMKSARSRTLSLVEHRSIDAILWDVIGCNARTQHLGCSLS